MVITDDVPASGDGASTADGDAEDDFFSSWDKPSIKRPSNPPSRTSTPPTVGRTGSPFLTAGANGNGTTRPKSPLSSSDKDTSSPPPTAVRSGSVVRKGATTTTAKKGSVLSSKKTQKLGAKKVGGDAIDFEEAERKAKEEAERIEKLGYDPEAEQAEAEAKEKAAASSAAATKIASPTPISPSRGGFGATSKTHERSPSEVERLGMGMARLGFGQTKAAPKKPGFGAVGPAKSAVDGMLLNKTILKKARLTGPVEEELEKTKARFGNQKGISSDEFFGRDKFDPAAQAEAKERLRNFEGATAISSNAYFGRPEDDLPSADDYGGYGDLESAAKDFIRRFGITAGDDLENLTQMLGEGASKLQGKYLDLYNSMSCQTTQLTWRHTTGAIRSYLNS